MFFLNVGWALRSDLRGLSVFVGGEIAVLVFAFGYQVFVKDKEQGTRDKGQEKIMINGKLLIINGIKGMVFEEYLNDILWEVWSSRSAHTIFNNNSTLIVSQYAHWAAEHL